jgi:tetratricopeptide (TPR) repeat protein
VLLVCGVAVVFGQSLRNEFVDLDDNQYVTENPDVFTGLSWKNIYWSITAAHSANWHPLTWMSHQLDCQVYGLNNPWGHHLTNLLLYAAMVALLFLLFERMTGALWRSAAMTALFALHPLRAESVAWVAERKDVLSGLLFVLTLWFYCDYVRSPRRGKPVDELSILWTALRYLLVLFVFALGLTAKSMLVTVPFILTLLDFWPLGRWKGLFSIRTSADGWPAVEPLSLGNYWSVVRIITEKVPLFALSAFSCRMTIWSQSQVPAIKSLELVYRVGNAIVSYVAYLGQTLWPVCMVLHYPHPGRGIHWFGVYWAGGLLLAVTFVAIVPAFFKRPYALIGWLWYLGMLVPVIGLVQVGAQAHADRYTFLPHIGLFMAIVWLIGDCIGGLTTRVRGMLCCAVAPLVLCASMAVAWKQTSYWQNNMLLWQHSVSCQPDTNDYAQNMLAGLLSEAGDDDGAIEHYTKSININPIYGAPYVGLAGCLYKKNRLDDAARICVQAISLDPENSPARNVYGVVLYGMKKAPEAIEQLQMAVKLDPQNSQASSNLCELLRLQGKFDEAIKYGRMALQVKPNWFEAHRNLARTFCDAGRQAEACAEFAQAVALNPRDVLMRHLYGESLAWQDKLPEARAQFVAVSAFDSGDPVERLAIARRLATDPRDGLRDGAAAARIAGQLLKATDGKDLDVLDVLAMAYAEEGNFAQAEAVIVTALRLAEPNVPKAVPILQDRLARYRAHYPIRVPAPAPPVVGGRQ